jgi:lipoprotein-anchoring transpeptidase ErfK/SrfK
MSRSMFLAPTPALAKIALAGAFALAAIVGSGALAFAQQAEAPAAATAQQDEPSGAYAKQVVSFRSDEPAGTIVIDTKNRYLYLVQPNHQAIRYGIGVGRDGFRWSGRETVTRKEEWPDWRPPQEMIGRQPYLPRFVAGGEGNPMGARALYLGQTAFRIHGTNQPETIGHAVSSGCFRLANDDVVDLYDRVQVGATVVVRQDASL